MPIPTRNQEEKPKEFLSRCMGNPTMVSDYKDRSQRYAICYSQLRRKKEMDDSKVLYKQIPYQIKEVKDNERKILAVVTKEVKDSDGDIVKIDGIDLERYIKTGAPLMWAHKHSDPPIGKATMIQKVNDEIIAEFQYATSEEYSFADTIFKLTKGGYINSFSIGFKPDWTATKNLENGRYLIEKSELLEISSVPIPANSEANVISRALSKAFNDKVIDEIEMDEAEIYLKTLEVIEDNTDDEFDKLLKEIQTKEPEEKEEQTINTKKKRRSCKSCGSDLICPICDEENKSENTFEWIFSQLDIPSPNNKESDAESVLKSLGIK